MIADIFTSFIEILNLMALNPLFIGLFAFVVVTFVLNLIWNLVRYDHYI